jgi:hypothetical protein
MKRNLLTWLLCLISVAIQAQSQPVWTKSINALPDSGYMFPVRTIVDANNNSYVLSAYGAIGGGNNKIVVNKIGSTGSIAWTFVYNHGGTGSPRGFDMVLNNAGQCFIAGGFMDPPYKILLMKISPFGSLDWVIDSTSSGQTGTFEQAMIHYNKIYISGASGVAVFDFNGNELWSKNINASRMAVDNLGQAIVTGYATGATVWRYDSLGNQNFSDSTIDAKRICTDSHNSIILLSDIPEYTLVKYDSAGNFLWKHDTLAVPNSFGDIGFEVLTDPNDNILAVGLSDTMFKYSPSGSQLWWRSMNGLDGYLLSARMNNDLLLIAGMNYNSMQYDVEIRIFNSLGWANWTGGYNSNNQQEFSVDVAIGSNGFYVLEDSISNTDLLYFSLSPGLIPPDFSLYCVDSVWYDTINPGMINVRIFNGDINHINYPTVRIIAPNGDTISNKNNIFGFFAQLGNTYQVYTDTITVQGITDFSGYSFLMTDNLSDTSAVIQLCSALSVDEWDVKAVSIYPNPARNIVHLFSHNEKSLPMNLYDISGRFIRELMIANGDNVIDISQLPAGMYFLRGEKGSVYRMMRIED